MLTWVFSFLCCRSWIKGSFRSLGRRENLSCPVSFGILPQLWCRKPIIQRLGALTLSVWLRGWCTKFILMWILTVAQRSRWVIVISSVPYASTKVVNYPCCLHCYPNGILYDFINGRDEVWKGLLVLCWLCSYLWSIYVCIWRVLILRKFQNMKSKSCLFFISWKVLHLNFILHIAKG